MSARYELHDPLRKVRIDLGAGPFGALLARRLYPKCLPDLRAAGLAVFQHNLRNAWDANGGQTPSVGYIDRVCVRIWAFLEASEWRTILWSDCGSPWDDELDTWPIVDVREDDDQ